MWLDHCGGSTLDLMVLRPAGSITAFQHHVTRTLRRFLDLLVLRPDGSITAFQHHVTRSLRRFNVGSLVFILLSVQCSLVLRPWIFLRCSVFFLLLVYCSLNRRLWIALFVQCSYSVLFGSSPCWLDHCVSTPCDLITAAVLITMWLDHCVSTPCDSITAAVPRWISRFFALLARSLRFNTMFFDH
jgi:hypothetical protein